MGFPNKSKKRPHNENFTNNHFGKKPKLKIKENVSDISNDLDKEYNNLPIQKVKDRIICDIKTCDVYILCSTTGSGKTTQVPKFLYESGFTKFGKLIGITQPRQLAAKTTAERVANEMKVKLGDKVGYVVRFDHKCTKETQIKFMTDGILLQESKNDKLLSKYSVIILDEVHERSVNSDILLGIVKNAQKERSKTNNKLKIIVMSATMNIALFEDYFRLDSIVKCLKINEELNPLEIMYATSPIKDYIQTSVFLTIALHIGKTKPTKYLSDFTEKTSYSILIFLTGEEEIKSCCALLNKANEDLVYEGYKRIKVLPLYAAASDTAKAAAISFDSSAIERNIIVATNIAETSLTIPGVRIVMDCGRCKKKVIKPDSILESLEVQWISKGQCQQRAGRGSRLGPGICYRLYEDHDYLTKMTDEPVGDLNNLVDLDAITLSVISLGFNDPITFPWLENPDFDRLHNSVKTLKKVKALDNTKENAITDLGNILLSFPLPPRLALVILLSSQHKYRCLSEMLALVSMLNVVENLWQRLEQSTDNEDDYQLNDKPFHNYYGDLVSLIIIFREFKKNMKTKGDIAWQWCQNHSLKFSELQQAAKINSQLRNICNELHLEDSHSDDYSLINRCFLEVFPERLATLVPSKSLNKKPKNTPIEMQSPYSAVYSISDNKNVASEKDKNKLFNLHPSSVICATQSCSRHVLYLSLTKSASSKSYLKYIARITPEMITPIGCKKL